MEETQQSSTDEAFQTIKITPEKRLAVLEIFGPTLQGEGAVIGAPTMFIRFGGCDYRCEQCDSLHAVLPELIKEHATYMTADEIIENLNKKRRHCNTVTFSGGNPCMLKLGILVELLHKHEYTILVETQGTLWKDWLRNTNFVTISPKGPGMGEKFEPDVLHAFILRLGILTPHCLKVVIFDQRDIEFAKEIHLTYPNIPMYLSLGNPWPPQVTYVGVGITMAEALLERMRILLPDIQNEKTLADVKFLPQLHVLLWGNELGK